MYSQARTRIKPFSTQTIQELDPFRSVYQLQSGNAYPWYGAKAYTPSGRAASPPRTPSGSAFGKKRKRNQWRTALGKIAKTINTVLLTSIKIMVKQEGIIPTVRK